MIRVPAQIFVQHIFPFLLCYDLIFRENAYDLLESILETLRFLVGIVFLRVLREDQESDLFRFGEIIRFPAEIVLCRGFEAVVQVPEAYAVDIFREYLILRIQVIEAYGV